MSKRYPRDPIYGKPPRWSRVYDKFFPWHTDGASRHTKCITEMMRNTRSPFRAMLIEAGYEPDHMASSMEVTVTMLWEARAEIERLKGSGQNLADATPNKGPSHV